MWGWLQYVICLDHREMRNSNYKLCSISIWSPSSPSIAQQARGVQGSSCVLSTEQVLFKKNLQVRIKPNAASEEMIVQHERTSRTQDFEMHCTSSWPAWTHVCPIIYLILKVLCWKIKIFPNFLYLPSPNVFFFENFNVFKNNTICVEAANFWDTMYGILETAKSIWNERRTFHDASCHRSGKMLS